MEYGVAELHLLLRIKYQIPFIGFFSQVAEELRPSVNLFFLYKTCQASRVTPFCCVRLRHGFGFAKAALSWARYR